MERRRTVRTRALGFALALAAASVVPLGVACGESFREGPLEGGASDAAGSSDDASKDEGELQPDAGVDDAGPCLGDAAHALPPLGTTCDGGAAPDFGTDRANCGGCGHACAGGDCARGLCQAVVVATDRNDGGVPPGGGTAIGVLGTDLVWAYPRIVSASSTVVDIERMPRGGAPRVVATVPSLTAATLDATGIYVASGTALARIDPDTGASSPIAVSVPSTIVEIVANLAELYVIDAGGGIRSVSKTSGASTPIASGERAPRDLVVAAPWIAWLDAPWVADPNADAATSGSSLARTYAGAPAKPFALDFQHPTGTFADARHLYWFDVLGRALWATSLDPASSVSPGVVAGLPRPIDDAGTQTPLRGLLRDGTRVFAMLATEGDLQQILELSTCGGPVTVLFDDRTHSVRGRMVQDDAFLYWTAYGGDVLRLAK